MTEVTQWSPETLTSGRRCEDPCAMVIFGATGDLTRRKLMPALYNLLLDGLLPKDFAIVGVSRTQLDDNGLREMLRKGLEEHSRRPIDEQRWEWLSERICHVYSVDGEEDPYVKLRARLEEVDGQHKTGGNRLFYMAIPPSAFAPVVERLRHAGLNRPGEESWARLVVEKPIGTNLTTASRLNDALNGAFPESSVYRIDHYLGKETVQNLLVFRFANSIFEPLWNQKYVDHVQITVAESIGVGTRGGYYEEAGATRDMLQNHVAQLICLTAMEPPVSMHADAIRDEKVKVLQALRPIQPEEVDKFTVRGQYTRGLVDGEPAIGYKEVEGVAENSRTETYVAMRVSIDNWRWAGVPFYIRSGKRMTDRVSEVALVFNEVPHRLFSNDTNPVANTLAMRIQPNEGITLSFDAKRPGTHPKIEPVNLDFGYEEAFGDDPPEAYERLILDAMIGDGTLFIRRDEVEASWSFIDRLHEGWSREDPSRPLPEYAAGTWGPTEAELMLDREGRRWRRPRVKR